LSDGIALVRALGALLTVLGILAGALWAVRRFNIVLPGTGAARSERRLAIVERLSLDPRRSLALLRRDGIEHLVLLAPEGHLVIESRIIAAAATGATPPEATPESVQVWQQRDVRGRFAALVDGARRLSPAAPDVEVPASRLDQYA
jgi:hypothetical protein